MPDRCALKTTTVVAVAVIKTTPYKFTTVVAVVASEPTLGAAYEDRGRGPGG